jgi:uncharacterized protein (DUF58 family)
VTLRLRFLDQDTVRRLGRLQIAARGLVEGFLAGVHASPYLGASVEFADHRSYVPGDEPRRIDWKVYGKRDRYFVKQFREETNLIVYLLVDGSASMTFRSGTLSKLEYACMLAEAMSIVVLRQNDAACCGVFDREAIALAEPGHGLSYLDQLSEVLDHVQPVGGTDIARSLRQFAECLPRRGIAAVISDFLDEADAVTEGLKVLKLAGHEVIALQVRFEGLETPLDLRIEPQRIRRAYLSELGRHLRGLRDGLSRAGIEYRLTDTRRPIDALLRALLAARHQRRRTAP